MGTKFCKVKFSVQEENQITTSNLGFLSKGKSNVINLNSDNKTISVKWVIMLWNSILYVIREVKNLAGIQNVLTGVRKGIKINTFKVLVSLVFQG